MYRTLSCTCTLNCNRRISVRRMLLESPVALFDTPNTNSERVEKVKRARCNFDAESYARKICSLVISTGRSRLFGVTSIRISGIIRFAEMHDARRIIFPCIEAQGHSICVRAAGYESPSSTAIRFLPWTARGERDLYPGDCTRVHGSHRSRGFRREGMAITEFRSNDRICRPGNGDTPLLAVIPIWIFDDRDYHSTNKKWYFNIARTE